MSTRSRATATSSACRTSSRNGGDEAESETPFLVVRIMHDGQSDIFATGLYLDTYRVAGNDLKFSKRLVVCDSSRVDTLMALPL